MDFWSVAWVGWLVLFGVLEGVAIFRKKKGDTLSEKTWLWFSVKHDGKWAKGRRFVLLVLMGWVTVHFLTGGFV